LSNLSNLSKKIIKLINLSLFGSNLIQKMSKVISTIRYVLTTKNSVSLKGQHLLNITNGNTNNIIHVNNPIFEYNFLTKQVDFSAVQYYSGYAKEVYGTVKIN
jgi:hypothetical protein